MDSLKSLVQHWKSLDNKIPAQHAADFAKRDSMLSKIIKLEDKTGQDLSKAPEGPIDPMMNADYQVKRRRALNSYKPGGANARPVNLR